MYNPVRRNRNIGTSRQGHGQDNKLTIPQPALCTKVFFERLHSYEKCTRTINGHDFIFVTEQTRDTSEHACSINDIEKIIGHIPASDYGELKWIILRQPRRKEELLSPVWGRLAYSYEFEQDYCPAIIVEAIDYARKFKWPAKLSLEAQKELDRLKEDGHPIIRNGRFFTAPYEMEHVRSTQLYRTIPHELGHYVHYLNVVVRPGQPDEPSEAWEARNDLYFKIPHLERERFAHAYADRFRQELIDKMIIPFDPL